VQRILYRNEFRICFVATGLRQVTLGTICLWGNDVPVAALFCPFFLPEASFSALLKTMLLKTIPGLTLPGIGTPGQFLSARPEFSGQPWCLNN
jgi:hypothetical protein